MELLRALGSLIDAPSPQHGAVARALGLPEPPSPAEHGRVVASQRWPYASVYLGSEGMMGGDARARIAGFRRALGADLGQDGRAAATEADHLAALLDLLAALDRWGGNGGRASTGGSATGPAGPMSDVAASRPQDSRAQDPGAAHRTLLGHAKITLVREHIAPWLGPYLASFHHCGSEFYEAWATLLGRAIGAVQAEMESEPDSPPSPSLPAALRAAPALPDPRRAGGEAFVAGLLAPVRSGMILVRDDLARLARDAGLACRAGERRYVLVGLLAQDPGGTLARLSRRAREWRERLSAQASPARIAQWWAARADTTARLLSELAREAAPRTARPPATSTGAAP